MAKKGQNFRMIIGTKCVAASTDCSYHVGTSLEEDSTKDTTGDWQSQSCVGKNWDCNVSALVVDDATGMTDADVLALIGTTVTVKFDDTSGDKNRTAGGNAVGGTAIVSDFTKNASNRQNQTWTAQFQGIGAFGSVS